MPTFGLHPPSSSTSVSPAYGPSGGVYWQPGASGGDCIKYQCHRAVPLLPTPPPFSFGPGPPSLYHPPTPHARLIPVSGSLDCVPPAGILSYGTSFHNDIAMGKSSITLTSSCSPFGPVFPPSNSNIPEFDPFVAPFSPSSPSLSIPSMVPPLPPYTFQDHHPLLSSPSESSSSMAHPFSCSNSLSDGFACFQDPNQHDISVSSPSPVFSTWLHPLNCSSIPSSLPDDGPCSELLADRRVSMGSLHQPYVGPQYPSPLALPPGSEFAGSNAVPQFADDARSGHIFFSSEGPPPSFPEAKHQRGGTSHYGNASFYLKELDSEGACYNWSLEDRPWNVGSEFGYSSISPEELRWERHQRLLDHSESKLHLNVAESGNSQSQTTGSYGETGLPGLCSAYSEHDTKDELSAPPSLGYNTPSLKWAASALAEMIATVGDASHDSTTPLPLEFGAADVLGSSLSSSLGFLPPSLYRASSLSGLSYYKLNEELEDQNNSSLDSLHYGPGLSNDKVRVRCYDSSVLAPIETQKQGQRLGKNAAGQILTNGNSARPVDRTKRDDPSFQKRSKAWYAKEVSSKSLSATRKTGSKGPKEVLPDAGICDKATLAIEFSEVDTVTSENFLSWATDGTGEDLKPNQVKSKHDLERKGSRRKLVENRQPQGNLLKSSSSAQPSGGEEKVNTPDSVICLEKGVHETATGQDATTACGEAPVIATAGIATPSIWSSSSLIGKPFLESHNAGNAGNVLDSQSTFRMQSHGLNVHDAFTRLSQEQTVRKDGKGNKSIGSSGTQSDIAVSNQIASVVDAHGDKQTPSGIQVVHCTTKDHGESPTRNRSCSQLYEPGLQSVPQRETSVHSARPSHTVFPSWLPTANMTSYGSSCFGQCNSVDCTSTPCVCYPSKLLETSRCNVHEFPCFTNASSSAGLSSAALNQGVSKEDESLVTPRFTSLTKSVETLSSVLLACLSSSFSSVMATHIDALQKSIYNISECLFLEVSAKGNDRPINASADDIFLKDHQGFMKQMQGRSMCSVPPAGMAADLDGKASAVCSEKSEMPRGMKDCWNSEKGSVASLQEPNNHQEYTQDMAKVSKDELVGNAPKYMDEEIQSSNSKTYDHYDIESLQFELRAKEAEIARLKFQALKNAILKVRTSDEKLAEVEKLRKAEVLIDNLRDELEVEREENKGAMHLYKVMLIEAKDGAAHALREAERIKLELTALKAKMAQGSRAGMIDIMEQPETVEDRAAVIKARQDWRSTREVLPGHNDEFKLCVDYSDRTMGSCGVTGAGNLSHVESSYNHRIAEEDEERKRVELRAALIKGRNGSRESDEDIESIRNAEKEKADLSGRVDQQNGGSYPCSSTDLHSAQRTRSGFGEGEETGDVASKLQQLPSEGFGSFTTVSADESLETGCFAEMEEPGWEHVLPVTATASKEADCS